MSHLLIDIEKLPAETQVQWLPIAQKFNALVEKVEVLQGDVDKMLGTTQEEKTNMFDLMEKVRVVAHYTGSGSHKINITLMIFMLTMLLAIARNLGVDTHQVGPLIMQAIHAIFG